MLSQGFPANLSDDDVLSLWVGRVARTHALLEYDVDNVRRYLSRRVGRNAALAAVKGFDQLAAECSAMLGASGAHPEIVAAGQQALHAARRATQARNRVVHDMWLAAERADVSASIGWNSFRRSGDVYNSYNSAVATDLATVAKTHSELLRCRVRVSGLFMALHAVWPADPSRRAASPEDSSMRRYLALMRDDFSLEENGDVSTT